MDESAAVPEFGGECAFAVSLGKSGDPESGKHQLVREGKTYYFRNAVARFLFKTFGRSTKAHEVFSAR